jgi:hypothetical protein
VTHLETFTSLLRDKREYEGYTIPFLDMSDTTSKITNSQHVEEAHTADLELKDATHVQDMEVDPAAETKRRCKIDLYLMPALWLLLVFRN